MPNVAILDSLVGYNSYGAILGIPDGSFWMSSMVVENLTIAGCQIIAGDPWATAQYDVVPASVVITAYVPKTLSPSPTGHMPVPNSTVNSGVTIVNNNITQAVGVDVAVLMRATDGYVVSNNTISAPESDSLEVVKDLNSQNGRVSGNRCVLRGKPVPC